MKLPSSTKHVLVGLHIAAMLFGLVGMVVLPRTPGFFDNLPEAGQQIYAAGMSQGGPVYIVLGLLALALHGSQVLGTRRLLQFMIPALGLSLGSELLGTSTGFPFGAYSYTELLGVKIASLVPIVIPMSWFYMGLISYLLARAAFKDVPGLVGTVGSLFLGAGMLTAWDLALDPAMTLAYGPMFWEWHQTGPFFGMPLQNFAGWFATGLLYMSVARVLWRRDIVISREQLSLPLVIYTANIAFACAMCLGSLEIDLRIPVLLAIVLGQIPALLCWWFADSSLIPSAEASYDPAAE